MLKQTKAAEHLPLVPFFNPLIWNHRYHKMSALGLPTPAKNARPREGLGVAQPSELGAELGLVTTWSYRN